MKKEILLNSEYMFVLKNSDEYSFLPKQLISKGKVIYLDNKIIIISIFEEDIELEGYMLIKNDLLKIFPYINNLEDSPTNHYLVLDAFTEKPIIDEDLYTGEKINLQDIEDEM